MEAVVEACRLLVRNNADVDLETLEERNIDYLKLGINPFFR